MRRVISPLEERQKELTEAMRPEIDKQAVEKDIKEKRLQELKNRFGYALLWDAHSIPSRVPSLFPGELAELNIGTNNGASCPQSIREAVAGNAAKSRYTSVLDGRFRGGFITRSYGSPENRQYAIQLELAQRCYMDEESVRYDARRAKILVETLQRMLSAFIATAEGA